MYMLDLALPLLIYLYPGYIPVMLKFNGVGYRKLARVRWRPRVYAAAIDHAGLWSRY